jgi:hypothetical protein
MLQGAAKLLGNVISSQYNIIRHTLYPLCNLGFNNMKQPPEKKKNQQRKKG